MTEKSKSGFPLVTERYFGAEVEVLCLIEELKLHLVRIGGEFHAYSESGEDGLDLSAIDPEEFEGEIETVKLADMERFLEDLHAKDNAQSKKGEGMNARWIPTLHPMITDLEGFMPETKKGFTLSADENLLSVMMLNQDITEAYIGKTNPIVVGFVYTDPADRLFDASEFFLVVEKNKVTVLTGVWNLDGDEITATEAKTVALNKIPELKTSFKEA